MYEKKAGPRRREISGLVQLGRRWLHLARTSLYLAFFPQLIAGPIMKARDFIPQIGSKILRDIDWNAATRALITGYFLKMVVADNLAVLTSLMSYDLVIRSSFTDDDRWSPVRTVPSIVPTCSFANWRDGAPG